MDIENLIFRCDQCGWYSAFKDLKFVKEAMKYKRFFSCPKCHNMKFIVHLKKIEEKEEKKLNEKAPKVQEKDEKQSKSGENDAKSS